MTVAKDVVQFLMDIFGDRQAAQNFLTDPEGVLESQGLAGVRSADVDAAMPVVLDYAPLRVNATNVDGDFHPAGTNAGTGHVGGGWTQGGAGHDDHEHAVEQLTHVVANYSYPSTTEDRDSATDHSPTHNVWADGDVEQWFDNDSVGFPGDPAGGTGSALSFANGRFDHFFDLDPSAGSDGGTLEHAAGRHSSLQESPREDTAPYLDVDVPGSELDFMQDDPATIDINNNMDDAGAEEADYLDFGS